ncbi:Methyltransferase-like protein 13 [Rhynchospora pubera]|uniref:Methyltransferase-like protein 13 n=1 Tax=Rhynchospora pubera TaxID=906938 RepID=A0AAV8HQ35_9POAL|nr:Methyltransferase-like protein 13 [Rhynchospora pubera]
MDFSEFRPCRFQSFTFPNPNPSLPHHYSDPLRVAVLDSPVTSPQGQAATTSAMLVPPGRESDWIFSTEAGHLHLLLSSSSPPFSRLVLIGSLPSSFPIPYTRVPPLPDKDLDSIQDSLLPLLLALSPKSAFDQGYIPEVPFLSFEDDALHILPVEVLEGPSVGEMIVEDVAIQKDASCVPQIRRRLRFKRMPNLIQTQIRLIPDLDLSPCSSSDLLSMLESRSFRLESASLVQPYLAPMVAGLSLIANVAEEKIASEIRPSCLCVGVGGGALLTCLRIQFGFDVHGLETDSVVVEVARKYFGLVEDEFLGVSIGDGIGIIKRYAREKERGNNRLEKFSSSFDAVMVDLDSEDIISGVSAPPLEFIEKDVLLAVKAVLCKTGILVMNVIPPLDDGSFYRHLVSVLSNMFVELYKIDVQDNENFVIVATRSEIQISSAESRHQFLRKLEEVVGPQLVSSITKITSYNA